MDRNTNDDQVVVITVLRMIMIMVVRMVIAIVRMMVMIRMVIYIARTYHDLCQVFLSG
jgi:hypothetical protein